MCFYLYKILLTDLRGFKLHAMDVYKSHDIRAAAMYIEGSSPVFRIPAFRSLNRVPEDPAPHQLPCNMVGFPEQKPSPIVVSLVFLTRTPAVEMHYRMYGRGRRCAVPLFLSAGAAPHSSPRPENENEWRTEAEAKTVA
jgi:hypothetical protein